MRICKSSKELSHRQAKVAPHITSRSLGIFFSREENANADALSQSPLGPNLVDPSSTPGSCIVIVATYPSQSSAKGGDTSSDVQSSTSRKACQSDNKLILI